MPINSLSSTTLNLPVDSFAILKIVALDVGYNDLQGTMPSEICSLIDRKLVHLATDCERVGAFIQPFFKCDCCTQCYIGYKSESSDGGIR